LIEPGNIYRFFQEGFMGEDGWFPRENFLVMVLERRSNNLFKVKDLRSEEVFFAALEELKEVDPTEIIKLRKLQEKHAR